ncbi:unnamed protein product [Anisakis simplex]|uniref:ShKT domain-containing protein n=1 Tax=Anisakis simplex TaxID=6269 RepID=A0A158PNQ4_ANISI|nr:unnamed protein product [Anisakis simplex]
MISSVIGNANELPYKVYRIVPRSQKHLNLLSWIRDSSPEYEFDIWKDSGYIGEFADIMIPPWMQQIVENLFHDVNLDYVVTISDVMKLMKRNELESIRALENNERPYKEGKDALQLNEARLKDDPILDETADRSTESQNKIGILKAKYSFGDYGSYKDMMKYMRTIEFHYPNFTKVIRIGSTHEGIPIEGLKIGYPIDNTDKRAFWIDGNIHAREWASSHTALYFINQLVSGYGTNNRITNFIDKLNIFIFPCLNPDGYEYTRSEPSPMVRLWRKNRSPQKCVRSLWGGKRCCEGVDLNRNFDFHWSETGSSSNPCSNLYSGEEAFSEPESKAVRDFLTSDEMKDKLDGFITLHTYAQLWIHPYSHETGTYPMDHVELKRTAKRAVDKLRSVYGTQYKIGTGADTLSPASGGSDDWAKGILGVKYVYLVELRPELELSNGFILNKYELIPTAVETWEAVKVVISSALRFRRRLLNRAHLPSQLMRKQLYRQRALKEDSELLQRGEPIARPLDANLQPARNSMSVPSVISPGEQIAVASSEHSAEVNGAIVRLRNDSTTIIANSKIKPSFDHRYGREPAESVDVRSMARTLSTPVRNTFTSPENSHHLIDTTGNVRQQPLVPRLPSSFTNPNCRDLRYSCKFWIDSNPDVCLQQQQFMKIHCAYTCRFCVP